VYSTGVGAKTDQSELCEPGGDYHWAAEKRWSGWGEI
jgi:hypothetical protein